jgi:hypothetical protein
LFRKYTAKKKKMNKINSKEKTMLKTLEREVTETQEAKTPVDFDDVISTFNRISNFFVEDGYSVADAKKLANDAVKTKYGRDLLSVFDFVGSASEPTNTGPAEEEAVQPVYNKRYWYSLTEIGEELGISYKTVSYLLILGGYLEKHFGRRGAYIAEKAKEYAFYRHDLTSFPDFSTRGHICWKSSIIPIVKELNKEYSKGGERRKDALIPTQIGEEFGISPATVNKVLVMGGYQTEHLLKRRKIGYRYKVTEKGFPYATIKITGINRTACELAWKPSILPVVKTLLSEKFR